MLMVRIQDRSSPNRTEFPDTRWSPDSYWESVIFSDPGTGLNPEHVSETVKFGGGPSWSEYVCPLVV
jgi:hypothetical protein